MLTFFIYSLEGGGAERNIIYWIDTLKSYYDIELVLINRKCDYYIPTDIKVTYLTQNENKLFGKLMELFITPFQLKRVMNSSQSRVLVSFLNRCNYSACILKILDPSKEVIISERIAPYSSFKNGFSGLINRLLIKILYPYANKIITNSKESIYEFQNIYKIDNKYIHVNNILNSHLITFSENNDEHVIEKFSNKFTYISIGRLVEQKNHILLIYAFIKANIPNTQLVIIGKGNKETTLRDIVNRLGFKDRIIFMGFQNNPYKYLMRANCFVLSSLFEGFPNVILEALALNIPVISTDCPTGPKEILDPFSLVQERIINYKLAEYGILSENNSIDALKNAMLEVFNNVELRNSYITKSSSRVREFESDFVRNQILNAISF